MKILICDAFDPTLPDLLKKHGEVTSDINELPNATVALVRSKTKGDRDFIDKGKSLKMIIRGGVGLDNIDVKYAREKNIEVRNTAEASSIAVAELAFAMMIAVPNRLVEANTSMQAGKWMKKELKRTELYGKILGIIGCGRIGTELARRAKAFGMMVVGYDPSVDVSDDILIKPTLEDMLPICDYISIHTPLTDRTRGFINKETIADVVDALKSGKIGFYANDVWYSDPPETTPLVGAPNTLLAPHIGASTNENLLRIGKAVDRIITKAADAGFFGK